ncbi:hypothetical protein HPP92_022458 [Vanilla planifolia]|uniref:Non-haem dioxygenase N-terminal domain-containing protein n=1 Tax=Vanilla planifolia TaxID=51239 RepID=A0A835UFC0_VANPL|nr:hypothetical protein HPP92_022458 [Vanilla planifolia]
MAGSLRLPLVDLASTDRTAAAGMIRQACLEYGFFYLTNHGIDSEVFWLVFGESKKFFCLSFDEKMQLNHSEYHRGYTPLYAENLDPSTKAKGDLKESFYIGPSSSTNDVNQWPSEEDRMIWLKRSKDNETIDDYRDELGQGEARVSWSRLQSSVN